MNTQNEHSEEIELAKSFGKLCDGKDVITIMSALGSFTMHILMTVANDGEDAIKGLQAHNRDVENSLRDYVRGKSTEH